MKAPAILVLAAGSSSRMGKPKQLLPFQESTLLGTVIKNCLVTRVENVFCVLGAQANAVRMAHENPHVHFIENSTYTKGMSNSLQKGIQFILERGSDVSGVLVLLGDQPYLTKEYIEPYLELHEQHPTQMIATQYDRKTGVPALFPLEQLQALLSLKGDKGAQGLLQNLDPKYIVQLPKQIIVDIDTPQEYQESQKNTLK